MRTCTIIRDEPCRSRSSHPVWPPQVDTENVGFLVESESTCTKEAMQNVVKEVSRMEREELHAREDDGRGSGRGPASWSRQKYHFTLIRYRMVCSQKNEHRHFSEV